MKNRKFINSRPVNYEEELEPLDEGFRQMAAALRHNGKIEIRNGPQVIFRASFSLPLLKAFKLTSKYF
jgi:hypothetical protein